MGFAVEGGLAQRWVVAPRRGGQDGWGTWHVGMGGRAGRSQRPQLERGGWREPSRPRLEGHMVFPVWSLCPGQFSWDSYPRLPVRHVQIRARFRI